LWIKASHI